MNYSPEISIWIKLQHRILKNGSKYRQAGFRVANRNPKCQCTVPGNDAQTGLLRPWARPSSVLTQLPLTFS